MTVPLSVKQTENDFADLQGSKKMNEEDLFAQKQQADSNELITLLDALLSLGIAVFC